MKLSLRKILNEIKGKNLGPPPKAKLLNAHEMDEPDYEPKYDFDKDFAREWDDNRHETRSARWLAHNTNTGAQSSYEQEQLRIWRLKQIKEKRIESLISDDIKLLRSRVTKLSHQIDGYRKRPDMQGFMRGVGTGELYKLEELINSIRSKNEYDELELQKMKKQLGFIRNEMNKMWGG